MYIYNPSQFREWMKKKKNNKTVYKFENVTSHPTEIKLVSQLSIECEQLYEMFARIKKKKNTANCKQMRKFQSTA